MSMTRSIALPHLPVLRHRVVADLLLAGRAPESRSSSLPPRPLRRRLLLVVLPTVESSAPPRPPPWVPRLLLGRLRPPVVVTCAALWGNPSGAAAGPGNEEAIPDEDDGMPGVNKACPGAGAVLDALLVDGT